MFVGLVTLPLVKLTVPHGDALSPFNGPEFDDMGSLEFTGVYIRYGLECVFAMETANAKISNDGECRASWLYIIGYTAALFIIQLNLNSIMHHKFTRHAQLIYSIMVPITVLAFYFAQESLKQDVFPPMDAYQLVGLVIVGLGVFMQNWFKEMPQKASIEDDE